MKLEEQAYMAIEICNLKMEYYQGLMNFCEQTNNKEDWAKYYELHGAYKEIHKILTGSYVYLQ